LYAFVLKECEDTNRIFTGRRYYGTGRVCKSVYPIVEPSVAWLKVFLLLRLKEVTVKARKRVQGQ